MTLATLISDMDRRRSLAAAVNTNPVYLWQIATGRRRCGPKLAQAIHAQTHGIVRKQDLRPDLWGDSTS